MRYATNKADWSGLFCLKNTVFNQEKGKGIIIQFHISRRSQPLLGTQSAAWWTLAANRSDYMRTMMMEECTTIRLESERDRSGLGQLWRNHMVIGHGRCNQNCNHFCLSVFVRLRKCITLPMNLSMVSINLIETMHSSKIKELLRAKWNINILLVNCSCCVHLSNDTSHLSILVHHHII